MYKVELKSDTADKDWLGYQALIWQGKKKRYGFAAACKDGYQFILKNGEEGFTGEKGITVFPSILKTKTVIAAPKWIDMATYVKEHGRLDDYSYVLLNDCDMVEFVEQSAPDTVILLGEGRANEIAESLAHLDIVFGTMDVKQKRPLEQKAFYEPIVRQPGVAKYKL